MQTLMQLLTEIGTDNMDDMIKDEETKDNKSEEHDVNITVSIPGVKDSDNLMDVYAGSASVPFSKKKLFESVIAYESKHDEEDDDNNNDNDVRINDDISFDFDDGFESSYDTVNDSVDNQDASLEEDDDNNEDEDDKDDSKDDESEEHDSSDDSAWDDEKVAVILDKTTIGAIKRNDNLFLWEIEGLLKKNGQQHSFMYLRDNPPKLVFKRPGMDPFMIYLGKEEVNQLAPALEKVRRAYNAVPINDDKKEHFNAKNWKRKLREAFEDNPISFVGKIAAAVIVVVLAVFVIFL